MNMANSLTLYNIIIMKDSTSPITFVGTQASSALPRDVKKGHKEMTCFFPQVPGVYLHFRVLQHCKSLSIPELGCVTK